MFNREEIKILLEAVSLHEENLRNVTERTGRESWREKHQKVEKLFQKLHQIHGDSRDSKKKFLWKIRHIESGKFIKIKLEIEGIKHWKINRVVEGNLGWGKVLYDSHLGWSTPPTPSNEDFAEIGCEIVKYEVFTQEVEIRSSSAEVAR